MRHTLGYVNHMLRLYASNCGKQGNFQKEIDRRNFQTVEKVLNDLPEWDRNVIIEAYRRGDTLPDNIYWVAKELKVEQDMIWTLVSKVTKRIAKERGLI